MTGKTKSLARQKGWGARHEWRVWTVLRQVAFLCCNRRRWMQLYTRLRFAAGKIREIT